MPGSRGPRRNYAALTLFGNLYFNVPQFQRHQRLQSNGCIHWTAGKHRQGYGMCGGVRADSDQRFMTVTHRVAMMIHLNRELQPGENVIHQVGCNPLCVNPHHLQIGDLKLRNAIMVANGNNRRRPRGPSTYPHGKQSARTYKYSDQEIMWTRTATIPEIARHYNITELRARRLQDGMRRGYKWLKSPGQKLPGHK